MITERALPRLITLTPIVTILAFASVMIYGIITSQYENFAKESAQLEEEYLKDQKRLLQEENEKIHAYIAYHRGLLQEEDPANIKRQIIGWMESVRYGVDGYVWVHDTAHRLVAHPFRQESIGNDDTNNTDATGALIFRSFIDTAQLFPEGGFVEYYWARPGVETPAKKIGFLKLEPQYGWVIGTGVYVDDIVEELAKRKSHMEAQTDAYVQGVLLIAVFLTAVFGVVSYVISGAMVRVLSAYKESVALKERSLTQLNASLSLRIEAALEEAKAKDQALLHQSRLAQMGEMMSLIAHQWRQPLSEVLGIFMELETAAKFGKADQHYIEKEAKEGDRLIRYMSETIDDFRNFFKPESSKKRFCIQEACQEALTLAHASLKHQHIEVFFSYTQNLWAVGYPSAFAQVVLNVLQNAKDAHAHQGTKAPWIKIDVVREEEQVCVRLSDNAGGVDKEVMGRLFEPYVTTKKGSGTGLGLYMAKMIVEKHLGGNIEVANGEEGAVFTLRIPCER